MSAKIAKALHDVMSAVSYVQKNGKNTFQNYRYAGEADLLEKLRPAMLEAGLLLIPSVKCVSEIDQHGVTTVRIEYTLVHKDGDVWPDKISAAGQGGDRNSKGVGDKGLYKAITGANKYLLFKLFQIETGDDPENDQPQKRQNPHVTRPEDVFAPLEYDQNGQPVDNIPLPDPAAVKKIRVADQRPIFDELQKEIWATGSIDGLKAWAESNKNRLGVLKDDWATMLRGVFKEHMAALRDLETADDERLAS